ncbi:sorting nexin-3-like [Ischnura elegans]|uniref:sorting nexin-3-like n=1 Tax=Ischnura elegans TaxID=197161 RepID=UPI001ED8BA29|nr:sorting nexin-3-like [Ischnura elegans]
MGADDEDSWKPYELNVRVVDPVSFSSPYHSSHTTFNIQIKTNHPAFSLQYSEVRRRFSEFKWLRRVLHRHHPEREPPALPSRGLLVWNRFTYEFLESRRSELEKFVKSVVAVPCYLGEKAVHLFLQSDLNTQMIDLNLLGERDDLIVPVAAQGISSCDFSPERARNTCYAEDALNLLSNDGYGSSEDGSSPVYLDAASLKAIEANESPCFITLSAEAPLESSSVVLTNDGA